MPSLHSMGSRCFTNAGKVSAEVAKRLAGRTVSDAFRVKQDAEYESDFEQRDQTHSGELRIELGVVARFMCRYTVDTLLRVFE